VPRPAAPQITSITVTNEIVTLTFTGSTNDQADIFMVLSAPSPAGPFASVDSAQITMISPGLFRATMPQSSTMQFYRVDRLSAPRPQTPVITGISVNGGTVVVSFTGSTNDVAGAFKLLSAGSPAATFIEVQGAALGDVSPGVFTATTVVFGAMQFYRIQR
jgi:hypothetical protein